MGINVVDVFRISWSCVVFLSNRFAIEMRSKSACHSTNDCKHKTFRRSKYSNQSSCCIAVHIRLRSFFEKKRSDNYYSAKNDFLKQYVHFPEKFSNISTMWNRHDRLSPNQHFQFPILCVEPCKLLWECVKSDVGKVLFVSFPIWRWRSMIAAEFRSLILIRSLSLFRHIVQAVTVWKYWVMGLHKICEFLLRKMC